MPNSILSAHHVRLILLTTLITAIGVFDFIAVIYFSDVIFDNFFKSKYSWLKNIYVIGTFAIAYLARPVGGFLLGQYGDINGRKPVIFLSLLGVGLFTLIIGYLPNYRYIGILAPILFLLARFGQGLAYGGQIVSAWVYIAEQLPIRHVGFACGIICAGSLVATIILNILSVSIHSTLSYHQLFAFGWRIPFLIGGLTSLMLLYLMRFFTETSFAERVQNMTSDEQHLLSTVSFDGLSHSQIESIAQNNIFSQARQNLGLASICKNRPSSIIPAILISWIISSTWITITILLPRLISMNFLFSNGYLTISANIAIFFMAIGCVFFGYLVDRINVGRVVVLGGILLTLQSAIFFMQLHESGGLLLLWFALLGFSGGMIATLPSVLIRLFPSKIRLTSTSFIYNSIYTLISGLLPLGLGYATFHLPLAPGIYLIIIGISAIFLSFYLYHIPRNKQDIAR